MKGLLRLARMVDAGSEWMGRGISWLTLFMVLVTVVIVVLRYGFNVGFIWMQESVRFMHAIVFLLCAAYTLLHNEHVRVDIFYAKKDERGRAWVDLIGTLVFLVPVCSAILFYSWDYVMHSWAEREGSLEERGLHLVYLLKTCIWIFSVSMILQGLSKAVHALAIIRGVEHEGPVEQEHGL